MVQIRVLHLQFHAIFVNYGERARWYVCGAWLPTAIALLDDFDFSILLTLSPHVLTRSC